MTTLHDMTAGELLAAYRTRKFSPVEAVDAVIVRIEAWEPKLKALYAPDFEGARKQAKASEMRWQQGKPQGALDGVPITIKENIATKGVPVPLGTAATELVPAAADSPALHLLTLLNMNATELLRFDGGERAIPPHRFPARPGLSVPALVRLALLSCMTAHRR